MKTPCSFRKKLLSAAVVSTLGLSASGPLNADTIEFGFVGSFTMLNDTGASVPNNASPYRAGYNDPYGWYGMRTPIVGTITYDTATGAAVGTIAPFHFFGSTPGSGAGTSHAFALGVTFQKIDTAGTLVGSLLFSWNGLGHSLSIVLDASGMLDNLGATALSGPTATISGVGALPATNGMNFGTAKVPISLPLGPTPVATRTLNTGSGCDALTLATQVSPTSITTNQANVDTCTTGMVDDGIGADPMNSTAFSGFNANFDFRKLVVAKKNGVYAPPSVIYTSPADGATFILTGTTVNFTFVNPMQANTVAFTLKDAGNNTVSGTLSPSSSTSRYFTFTPDAPLAEPFTYTATIASATDENGTALSAPVTWSFSTGSPPAPGACSPVPQVPVGGNFTMLAGNGGLDQGTNDVAYTVDLSSLNTTVNGTNFNVTLSSPTSYYGHLWTAHHIRAFGPGTYTFNTGCTGAEIAAGISGVACAIQGANLSMTVNAGQIGAHMLFNWKTSADIDVVNVWNQNAVWSDDPDDGLAATNDMWAGDGWAGPAGVGLNPNTTWSLVSTDPDNDGINGVKMVDGPFIGFNANFNLGAADSCLPGELTPIEVGDITSASGGCSISRNPTAVSVLDKADWLLVGGFLAWLGALRRRFKRQTQS